MKNSRKRKLFEAKSLLTVLFLCLSIVVFAQTKTVKGTVLDERGESIIGASVSVKGTTTGTITDLDGKFTINTKNNDVLTISYVGYIEQSVSVAGQTDLKIILKEDSQVLDEFVVVGYGIQKKSDVTGAMINLSSEQLKKMPVTNPLQAMQGKAAGVDITSNERPGELGAIRIRGERSLNASNGPLYVVDGIPMQGVGIENLNPSDIESIEVLKDASATAIYGSRGANGVVLVTTKRGKSGSFSLNYSGTLSVEKMYDRMDMMNAGEWIDYSRLAKYRQGTYTSATPNYELDKKVYGGDQASWANFEKGWVDGVWDGSRVPTTDWTKYGLRTALTQEHTISASGGTEKLQAYMSFGYLNQNGTQPGQGYERYTAKVSVDINPTKWLKLGSSINTMWGSQEYGYKFRKSATGAASLYGALQGMLPWAVPYDENGDYIRTPGGDVNIINPIRESDLSRNQRKTLRVTGSFYAEISFTKDLKYRMNFGPDFYKYRNGIFEDKASINGDGNNLGEYNTDEKRSWTLDNLLYYNKTFNKKHALGVTLLQSSSKSHNEGSKMKATGLATSSELWYNLGSAGNLTSFSTELTETQLMSYMARVNYSLSDKYLLTASGRWDGASQLADGHKWSFFPSAALGWRIEQEKFMQDIKWVSQLKLRFGVGTTGNSAIDAYATKGALSSLYYTWGPNLEQGLVSSDPSAKDPIPMVNSNLGWEKTTQYNLGLDFSIFNNRLSGTIDVYKSTTKDLLMLMALPLVTGYPTTWANIGETENHGVDLTLNSMNIDTKDFTWNTSLTFSADRNKITKLANGKQQDLNNKWFVGEPLGVYYDYVYDGIWKTSEAEEAAKYGAKPGEIRVKDLDNSGDINANYDRKIVGSKRPDWSAGLMNTFTYKNWEFSFFLYSRWGFTVETGAETLSGRFAMRKLDYWVEGTNEDAKYYAPGTKGESGDTYKSTMNYQDGSFIKLRNVSLGYNVNPDLLKKLEVKNLKVYVQCMNPGLVYSKCDWIDPDLGGSTYNRSLVFGLNVGF